MGKAGRGQGKGLFYSSPSGLLPSARMTEWLVREAQFGRPALSKVSEVLGVQGSWKELPGPPREMFTSLCKFTHRWKPYL